jgi:hypothetical protein
VHFEVDATDYEALFVKRNAPRRIEAVRHHGFLSAAACPFTLPSHGLHRPGSVTPTKPFLSR